jgi:hypothetical protein
MQGNDDAEFDIKSAKRWMHKKRIVPWNEFVECEHSIVVVVTVPKDLCCQFLPKQASVLLAEKRIA